MRIKGFLLVAFLQLAVTYVLACNCATTLPKISRDETEQYNLIFSGYLKKLYNQNNENYAEFVVETPYKGLVPRDIKVKYDGITSCKMPFLPGDQWLMYIKKDTVHQKWMVNYCERSRKFPEPGETDNYTVYSGITIDEEIKFLESNYTSGQIVGEDTLTMIEEEHKIVIDSRRDMEHGTPRQRIYLLIGSLAGMIVIYLIIKRFVK